MQPEKKISWGLLWQAYRAKEASPKRTVNGTVSRTAKAPPRLNRNLLPYWEGQAGLSLDTGPMDPFRIPFDFVPYASRTNCNKLMANEGCLSYHRHVTSPICTAAFFSQVEKRYSTVNWITIAACNFPSNCSEQLHKFLNMSTTLASFVQFSPNMPYSQHIFYFFLFLFSFRQNYLFQGFCNLWHL